MKSRDEATKVKLFLYLIGSQGREIYYTMAFEIPASERTLTQVLEAFYRHCNPRKNATVGSFQFFSRTQDPGESQEKFATDLKLLATTCNFGHLKDLLVRDRIICGIQDRQLREELLKIPDLDLQRCLSICRAAELSKTRTKTLEENEAVNSLKDQTKRGKVSANKSHDKSANKRRENDDRNARESSPEEVLRCKFCGGKHRAAKKSCPAFGRRCSACGRMNHFASQCLFKTRVNVVESESESQIDEYYLTLHSVDKSQVVTVHVASDREYAKKIVCYN